MNGNNKPLSLNYALHRVITTNAAFFAGILQNHFRTCSAAIKPHLN